MDPELRLRERCIEMATRSNPANPTALFETAAAIERFIKTGDYRRYPAGNAAA